MRSVLQTILCAASLLHQGSALPTPADTASDTSLSIPSFPRAITYVQSFETATGGNLSLLPIRDQHTRLSHLYIAAFHVDPTPGEIHLNDQDANSTYWENMWAQVAELQRSNLKVMAMLGGAAQGSFRRLCSGDPTGEDDSIVINDDYYLPLYYTLKYHRVDGIDLDIEERVFLECPLALLNRIYTDFGRDFIITMAPVATDLQPQERGLSSFKYSQLDAQATAADKPNGKIINWFNAQFYNGWGNVSSPVGYNAIINHGYDPSRVVLGVLDSPNDGGSGWQNLSVYTNTINQLRANYPTFGGVVSWEYHDAGLGDEEHDTFGMFGKVVPGNGTYHDDPWVWERSMADVVYGYSSGPSGGWPTNFTYEPIPAPNSPWPDAAQVLEGLGVTWTDAILALNSTAGDLQAALNLLGDSVDNLLSGLL